MRSRYRRLAWSPKLLVGTVAALRPAATAAIRAPNDTDEDSQPLMSADLP